MPSKHGSLLGLSTAPLLLSQCHTLKQAPPHLLLNGHFHPVAPLSSRQSTPVTSSALFALPLRK